MKYKILFLIGFISLLGCQSILPSSPLPFVKVVYFMTDQGSGWHKTITISDKGAVTIIEQPNQRGKNQTIKAENLSEAEQKQFLQLVIDAKITTLDDDYSCHSTCQKSTLISTLQLTVDQETKKIIITTLDRVPPPLKRIVDAITQIESTLDATKN